MRPRVSVIVPTYNRPELLARCLAALVVQDFDPDDYEIIVVSDGQDEETRQVVDAWARSESHGTAGSSARRLDNARIRYCASPSRRGPAAARNIGWGLAEGDIIAFTDDDCIPTPGWLRAGVEAMGDSVVGASGRVVVPLSQEPTDYELNSSWLEQSEFVTANCFYRRSALETVGGFDEHFTTAWREDSDLLFTLLERAGTGQVEGRFVKAKDAIVVHPVRTASWGVSLSQQRKSMFNALLYKKHQRLYRERLGRARPWRYYAIVGALALAIGGLVTGKRVLVIGSGLVWAGMTGQFSAERLRRTSRHPRHVAEMITTSVLIPPLALFWRLYGACKYRVVFV